MKVEAADPKVSGELLFPPPYGIIGIVIRFKSSLRRSTTLRQPASRQEGEGRMGMKEKKKEEKKKEDATRGKTREKARRWGGGRSWRLVGGGGRQRGKGSRAVHGVHVRNRPELDSEFEREDPSRNKSSSDREFLFFFCFSFFFLFLFFFSGSKAARARGSLSTIFSFFFFFSRARTRLLTSRRNASPRRAFISYGGMNRSTGGPRVSIRVSRA